MIVMTDSMHLKRRLFRPDSSQMIYLWPFREQMTSFRIISERRFPKDATSINKIKDITIYKTIKEYHLTKQDQLTAIETIRSREVAQPPSLACNRWKELSDQEVA